MTIDISEAILSLGQYEFVVRGEINSEEDWNNNVQFVSGADENGTAIFFDTKPITYAEVLAEQQRLQADYDAKEYQRKRAAEYPSIGDQLDKLWHSINADDTLKTQFADFYNTIKAVKDEYPKE
jgi:thymidylate kinase